MSDEVEELKTEHQFTLTRELKYSSHGDQVNASFIMLKAPSSRNKRECAFLKQAFLRASHSLADDSKEKPEKAPKLTGNDVVTMLGMSKEVDLGEVYVVAQKLFTDGGVALIDGEAKFTKHVADSMDQDEFERMVGEYLVNFTLASTLREMGKDSSEGSPD